MQVATDEDRQVFLPPGLKHPAAVVCVAAAVALVAFGVAYHGADTAGAFDRWVEGVLPGREIPSAALRPVTLAFPLLLGAGVVIAWLPVRTWRRAVLAVAGPAATLVVVEAAKFVVGRTYGGVLCLPSGHTAVVTSLALVATLLVVDRLPARARLVATAGLVAASVLAGAMAWILVVLRWHHPTDTIAGYCAAIATTLGVAFVVDARTGRSAEAGRGSVVAVPVRYGVDRRQH